MKFVKKFWKLIVSVIGAVLGLVFLKQFFQKDLKAKLNNANAEKDSAVLDSKIADTQADIKAESNKNNQLRDAANQPTKALTPQEAEDYWNKK